MKEQEITAHDFALNKEIIHEYYDAIESSIFDDGYSMTIFKEKYPNQYKHLGAAHRKRSAIRKSLNAMKVVTEDIYFGTLTFNEVKNNNKEVCKRKEAFNKLNTEFRYLLLVEEHGEDNGRYHIHFLGVFREDHDFDSFRHCWSHSLQNLKRVKETSGVVQYLCKYLSKDLPRVRRNKALVGLAREYSRGKQLEKHFPNVPYFTKESKCSVYDLLCSAE